MLGEPEGNWLIHHMDIHKEDDGLKKSDYSFLNTKKGKIDSAGKQEAVYVDGRIVVSGRYIIDSWNKYILIKMLIHIPG